MQSDAIFMHQLSLFEVDCLQGYGTLNLTRVINVQHQLSNHKLFLAVLYKTANAMHRNRLMDAP